MTLEQALQIFESVMPEDGSFISYRDVYGILMTTAEGRAAVQHFHPLRRQKLIAIDLRQGENGTTQMFIARQKDNA